MRRLHPASAAYRAVGGLMGGGGIGFAVGAGAAAILGGDVGLSSALIVLPIALLGAAIGGGLGVLQYLRFEYDVGGETVSIASGVFSRKERDIPFRRIQNVDVRRGIIARVIGVATVNLETAGGGSTEAVFSVVDVAEAERIQDVLAGHQRKRVADDYTGAVTAEADEKGVGATASEASGGARGRTLYELSSQDLAVLAAVSFDPSGLALLLFTLPFGQDFVFEAFAWTVEVAGGPVIDTPAAFLGLPIFQAAVVMTLAAIQFLLAAWVASGLVTAAKFFDFRLSRVGDDLRYERGLIGRYTGTIPLEKVQTVTVDESVLMRRVGLAGLSLETAGYGPSQGGSASNTAIPIDDRETVIALAEDLGSASVPEIERPPKRARRRYAVRMAIVPLLLAGVLLVASELALDLSWWWLPLLGLALAPVAGHLMWRNRGHALADDAFVARSGFWRRHTRIVPYYRIQTVIDTRSIFQRFRDLATVTADTASTASLVGGDASAHDVEEATAVDLHRTLRERLAADLARRRDGRTWLRQGEDEAGDGDGVDGKERAGDGNEVDEDRS